MAIVLQHWTGVLLFEHEDLKNVIPVSSMSRIFCWGQVSSWLFIVFLSPIGVSFVIIVCAQLVAHLGHLCIHFKVFPLILEGSDIMIYLNVKIIQTCLVFCKKCEAINVFTVNLCASGLVFCPLTVEFCWLWNNF